MLHRVAEFPRLIMAALRGGSGKTIVSIGIIAALRGRGSSVAPCKKGPDYIDAGWLALAAGRPCYNLDTFLLNADLIRRSFCFHTPCHDVAIIEGNRGLYDGIDLDGATSTAELAKLLRAPVLMCVDCTKTTRTMAAVISGRGLRSRGDDPGGDPQPRGRIAPRVHPAAQHRALPQNQRLEKRKWRRQQQDQP